MPSEILITPKSGEPQILFSGSGNVTPIELNVLSNYQSATGSGTALLFEGTQGQLFSITDNLSSGVIFSVSDITGLPLFEINASGDVRIGEYARYVGVGTGVPQYQLDVYGTGNFRGNIDVYGTGNFRGNINASGNIRGAGTSVYSPALGFNSTAGIPYNNGFWATSHSLIYLGLNGTNNYKFNLSDLTSNNGSFGIAAGDVTTNNADVIWTRDASGIWASRNGLNPQTVRVYNTYTSTGNWEGAVLDWQTTANTFRFGTAHGATGSDRGIEIIMGGSGVYRIETNGNHLFRSNGGSIVTGAGYAYSFQSNMNVTWMQITNSGTSVNTHGAFFGLNVDQFDLWNFQGGGIRLYTSTSTGVGQNTFTLSNRGNIKHCPVGQTSGSPIVLEVVAPPISGVPSGDSPDILFNLGRNILLASGNNQRETSVLIVPPTYSNVATGVITSGVTLRISGPPAAGSGTSITNSFALVVDSGFSSFGRIYAYDSMNSIETTANVNTGFVFRSSTNPIVGFGAGGIRLTAGAKVAFCSDAAVNTEESTLIRDTSNTIHLRNSTSAQTFRIGNTFTSTGNFEAFQIKTNTTQYELSSAVGATGSNRNILIGHTDSTGNFNPALTINTAGNTVTSGVFSAAKTNQKGYVFGEDTNWGMTYAFGSWVNINVTSSCQYRMANDGSITAYGPANMTILNGNSASPGWVTVKGNDVNISGNIGGHAIIRGGDHTTVDGSGGSAFIIGGNSNGTNVSNPSGNVIIRAGLGTGSGLGGSIIIQTSPAGPTGQANNAPVNNIVLDSSGLMTISGVRINNISVTGLIDNYTELTYTPAGSITLPLAKNHQTLDLISTTGNPTITLQTPQNSAAGTLIIKQGTTSRTINWGVSTGVLVWLGTQPTWASDPTGCYRVMTWRHNPSLLTTLVAVTESGI